MSDTGKPEGMQYYEDVGVARELFAKLFPLENADERMTVKIGPLCVESLAPAGFKEFLLERYEPFLSEDEPGFRAEVYHDKELVLDDFSNIAVKSDGETHYVYRWDFIAQVDPVARKAYVVAGGRGSPLCLDTIIRISMSFMAVQAGGLLVHSAGMDSPHGAFIFCGMSGAGKSTAAKLSAGRADVFTDEMTLVVPDGDGYAIWGTPFWGENQMSVNKTGPLRAVFLLKQAKEHRLESVPKGEALGFFLKVVLCFGQSKGISEALFDSAIRLLDSVDCRRLAFLPDPGFWKVIGERYGRQD